MTKEELVELRRKLLEIKINSDNYAEELSKINLPTSKLTELRAKLEKLQKDDKKEPKCLNDHSEKSYPDVDSGVETDATILQRLIEFHSQLYPTIQEETEILAIGESSSTPSN